MAYYRVRDAPESSSSSQSQPSSQFRGDRLTIEGRIMIANAIQSSQGRELTLQERKELLERIKRLPGCDFYRLSYLNHLLPKSSCPSTKPSNQHTHAAPSASPSKQGKSGTNQTPTADHNYPSLTPPMLSQLNGLLRLEGSPAAIASEKVYLWADMLAASGANRDDVIKWVHDHFNGRRCGSPKTNNKGQSAAAAAHRGGRNALLPPTPAGTATPEPQGQEEEQLDSAFQSPRSTVATSFAGPICAYDGVHSFYETSKDSGARYSARANETNFCPSRLELPFEAAPLSPVSNTISSPSPSPSPLVHNTVLQEETSSAATIKASQDLHSQKMLRQLIVRGLEDYERDSAAAVETSLPTNEEAFNIRWQQYEDMIDKLNRVLDVEKYKGLPRYV